MEVFVFMYITMLMVNFISNYIAGNNKRIFQAVSCFLVLWLIQGLRHESIGVDTAYEYRPYFESIITDWSDIFDFSDSYHNFEIGYIIYNKIFKFLISDNTQLFVLFSSLLSIGPIAYVIYKYSVNIVLSFWIFSSIQMYYFGFSGIRQAITIGICCLAYHFIVQKRILSFSALVLFASTFHTTAIIFLPAYFVYHKINFTPKLVLCSLVGIVLAIFSLRTFALQVVTFLFGGEKYISALSSDVAPSYNLILLFVSILLFTYISANKDLGKMRPFVLITIAFQVLGLISTHATRIGYYYYVFFSLVIPLVIETCSINMKINIIKFSLYLFFCAFFFYTNGNGYLGVIPYKFFWE